MIDNNEYGLHLFENMADGDSVHLVSVNVFHLRTARGLCEMAGVSKFPDERPLERDEVMHAAEENGQVMDETLIWPLVFTRHLIVVRKQPAHA